MSDESLAPIKGDGSSFLDKMSKGAKRRLEYLKGKQEGIGNGLKWLIFGACGLLFWKNLDGINHFLDGVVDMQIKLLYFGGLAFLLWFAWRVLSSKQFHYAVTLWLDILIDKLHHAVVARDKFGAARLAISRLEKRKIEAEEAKAKVYAVYQMVDRAAGEAEKASREAAKKAQGFEREINRRSAGGEEKPISREIAAISENELLHSFSTAKSRLRVNYEFFKSQAEKRIVLYKRSQILEEVGNATGEKLEEMRFRLQRAQEDWELALQSMEAMQASDDLIHGPEKQTYEEALEGICNEAQFFDGRVQMLMDRLDPTVQAYRMDKAAAAIADEDFYREWMSDTKIVKPEIQQRLLALPAKPEVLEIEQMLGSDSSFSSAKQEKAPVSTGKKSSFDDLLKRDK